MNGLFWALLFPVVMNTGSVASPELTATVEAQLMLGPFDGHGLPGPKSPLKARRARVIAQRASQVCLRVLQNRSGGSKQWPQPCRTPKLVRDQIPAMLERLNDTTIHVGEGPWIPETFKTMIGAVAKAGGAELVPVFITALERYALREAYADYFTTDPEAAPRFAVIEEALVTMTGFTMKRAAGDLSLIEIAKRWRAWHVSGAGTAEK